MREQDRQVLSPRVAVVSLYFKMYDEQMDADSVAQRESFLTRVVERLSSMATVVGSWMLAEVAEAAAANNELSDLVFDVMALVPSMVAPPALVREVLEDCTKPILLWNVPEVVSLPDELNQAYGAAHSSHVGCEMAANVLRRDERVFETVTCRLDGGGSDELDRLSRSLRALAVGEMLRRASVLRVGPPQDGYDDVAVDPTFLRDTGIKELNVDLPTWEEAVSVANRSSIAEVTDRYERWRDERLDVGVLEQSARLAVALETLVLRHEVECGTINCHSNFFRANERTGLTGCLGVSMVTGRGVPFSCTGDLPVALALLVGLRLAGAALYCELYTGEDSTGEMLIASGGEGDLSWAKPGTLRLGPNRMYPGRRGEGACFTFSLRSGPATLISLSPGAHRWQITWATGIVSTRSFANFDGPHGMFRFDAPDADDAARRWIAAGPSHHHALVPSTLDLEIPLVARAAGAEEVRV